MTTKPTLKNILIEFLFDVKIAAPILWICNSSKAYSESKSVVQLGTEYDKIEHQVVFSVSKMVSQKDCLDVQEHIQELEKFLSTCRDIREWKRAETVRLRYSGFSYKEIEERVRVSKSFIAQQQRRYKERGISGLKLAYQGSKSYLSQSEMEEIIHWIIELPERQNISELERHIMEKYDVVFKSRESYYNILKSARLTWQKARVIASNLV